MDDPIEPRTEPEKPSLSRGIVTNLIGSHVEFRPFESAFTGTIRLIAMEPGVVELREFDGALVERPELFVYFVEHKSRQMMRVRMLHERLFFL